MKEHDRIAKKSSNGVKDESHIMGSPHQSLLVLRVAVSHSNLYRTVVSIVPHSQLPSLVIAATD